MAGRRPRLGPTAPARRRNAHASCRRPARRRGTAPSRPAAAPQPRRRSPAEPAACPRRAPTTRSRGRSRPAEAAPASRSGPPPRAAAPGARVHRSRDVVGTRVADDDDLDRVGDGAQRALEQRAPSASTPALSTPPSRTRRRRRARREKSTVAVPPASLARRPARGGTLGRCTWSWSRSPPPSTRPRTGTGSRPLAPEGSDLVVFPEAFARDFGEPGSDLAPTPSRSTARSSPRSARGGGRARHDRGGRHVRTGDDPARPVNTLVRARRRPCGRTARSTSTTPSATASPTASRPADRAGHRRGRRLPLRPDDLLRPALPRAGPRLVDAGRRGARRPGRLGGRPAQGRSLATLVRARAIENTATSSPSASPARATPGTPSSSDPWGDVLAEAGEDAATLTAALDRESSTRPAVPTRPSPTVVSEGPLYPSRPCRPPPSGRRAERAPRRRRLRRPGRRLGSVRGCCCCSSGSPAWPSARHPACRRGSARPAASWSRSCSRPAWWRAPGAGPTSRRPRPGARRAVVVTDDRHAAHRRRGADLCGHRRVRGDDHGPGRDLAPGGARGAPRDAVARSERPTVAGSSRRSACRASRTRRSARRSSLAFLVVVPARGRAARPGPARPGVVLLGSVVLALTLAYAEVLRRYGAPEPGRPVARRPPWALETLHGAPRPVQALLGVPALVWGVHMRARRRQGWWVCAFGVDRDRAGHPPLPRPLADARRGRAHHAVLGDPRRAHRRRRRSASTCCSPVALGPRARTDDAGATLRPEAGRTQPLL